MPDASARRIETKPRIDLKSSALPTLTLAEIYFAQGHRERALETLRALMVRAPNDEEAKSLYERLQSGDVLVPEPKLKPESLDEMIAVAKAQDASSVLRSGPEPYCDAVRKVDQHVVARWSLGDAEVPKGAEPALFVITIAATWEGPKARQEIVKVSREGERELTADAQTIIRVALGFVHDSGAFVPVTHSAELESDDEGSLFAWTQRGRERVAVQSTSRG